VLFRSHQAPEVTPLQVNRIRAQQNQ
jgi:hypothetical protein